MNTEAGNPKTSTMAATAPTEIKPAPPPWETIMVKVDGKSIVVPKTMPDPITGRPLPTTMIQACAIAEVEVPHYCYHPRLPVAGNCRMCLVEFGLPVLGPDRRPVLNEDGATKIQKQMLPYDSSLPRGAIACATPVSPGMEIYTNTPGTKQMREAVLESLLINHPLDCPICDQAGECKLQEYSMEYGQAASRFAEQKVSKPKQVDLGPRIMLDAERCILCSRCIRFTRDIAGDDALGISNRGGYSTLTAYPGKAFDNNYTLNTVDLCPVGALTAKDFRFQMRVWFLKETKSVCASCGTGCNILIGSRENRIFRFVPRENNAVNACWMCDVGRLNYHWIGRPDRLSAVTKIQTAVTWQRASSEIISRLQSAAPGSVGLIASARQTNEELYLLKKLAAHLNAITDSVPRPGDGDQWLVSPDKNSNSTGARRLGIAAEPMGSTLPRIAAGIRKGVIKILIVSGEDVTAHGIDRGLLSQLELLVVTDLLPNSTTALAHYLLPGCAPAEKRGTFTNIKGRVQKFHKAIEPPDQARPEWEFLSQWVRHLTGEEGLTTIEGVFNRMAREIPAFHGLTWAGLGDTGKNAAQ